MDDADKLENAAWHLRQLLSGLQKVGVLPPLGVERLHGVARMLQGCVGELDELAIVARLHLVLDDDTAALNATAELDHGSDGRPRMRAAKFS